GHQSINLSSFSRHPRVVSLAQKRNLPSSDVSSSFFVRTKNEAKKSPFISCFFLRYAIEVGRKVFSLIPFSIARLRRSLTKGFLCETLRSLWFKIGEKLYRLARW
ncbi:MAG: hypothetical protein L3J61_03350, partial [Ghiorsea sp.]|nr:hypothetical protein [Ghiorsea sp.]